MRRFLAHLTLAAAALGLSASLAFAQLPGGGVSQHGSVTATHCAEWFANGQVEDSGAGCGGSGSPGGNPSTIQWNNAGSFGGISDWTTSGTSDLTGAAGSTIAVNGASLNGYTAAITGPSFQSGANQAVTFTAFNGATNATTAIQRLVTNLSGTQFGLYVDLQSTNSTANSVAQGIFANVAVPSSNATNISGLVGSQGRVNYAGTATAGIANGIQGLVTNSNTGTVTTAYAASIAVVNNGGGTIGTSQTINVGQPNGGTGGTWTQIYGIYIADHKPTGSDTLTNPPIALDIQSQTAAGAYAIKQEGSGLNSFAGATTLSAALTYGGVALSNSVTGTGSMVLSASPTLTGTIGAASETLSGNLSTRQVTEQASALTGCNGSTATMDLTKGTYFYCTVSAGTVTLAVSNPASSGQVSSFTLELTNGGSQTVNYMSGTKWPGGSAPTLTSSGVDLLVCSTRDGATTWRCVASELNSH